MLCRGLLQLLLPTQVSYSQAAREGLFAWTNSACTGTFWIMAAFTADLSETPTQYGKQWREPVDEKNNSWGRAGRVSLRGDGPASVEKALLPCLAWAARRQSGSSSWKTVLWCFPRGSLALLLPSPLLRAIPFSTLGCTSGRDQTGPATRLMLQQELAASSWGRDRPPLHLLLQHRAPRLGLEPWSHESKTIKSCSPRPGHRSGFRHRQTPLPSLSGFNTKQHAQHPPRCGMQRGITSSRASRGNKCSSLHFVLLDLHSFAGLGQPVSCPLSRRFAPAPVRCLQEISCPIYNIACRYRPQTQHSHGNPLPRRSEITVRRAGTSSRDSRTSASFIYSNMSQKQINRGGLAEMKPKQDLPWLFNQQTKVPCPYQQPPSGPSNYQPIKSKAALG